MKIVQFYDSYQVKGGVERVLSLLSNAWAGQGHQVTLLVRCGPVSAVYPLRPDVDIGTLGRPLRAPRARRLLDYMRDVRALRRHPAIAAADIVIANGPWCSLLMILARRNAHPATDVRRQPQPGAVGERDPRPGRPALVVCDHNSPSAFGRLTRLACRVLYRKADCILALTQAQRAHYGSFAGNVRVIPNPVAPVPEVSVSEAPVREVSESAVPMSATSVSEALVSKVSVPAAFAAQAAVRPAQRAYGVLALGRLTRQKGFDQLLEAWAIVVERAPGARLTIVGEGEEQAALQLQALRLALAESVTFAPFTDDVASVYRSASLLVMSSRYEGLALVALEAQCHGLPIVSFDCEFGPREVITDGVDGVLCEPGDIRALAEGVLRLLTDDALRAAMSAAARESAKRYALAEVLPHWDALFAALRSGREGISR